MTKWKNPVSGYFFILPWLVGFLLLTAWPMAQSVYFSLTDYSLLEAPRWLGTANYVKIFTDDSSFTTAVAVTSAFVALVVPLKLVFALFVALLLNQKLKGMAVYRTLIYFPSIIGTSVAISILWNNIFGTAGLLNAFLALFGVEGQNWIGNQHTALGTLVLLDVWQFGSAMVIFLAGLKQIPEEMYEAASVDGARRVRQFFAITLPMLSPILLFNLVLQVIGSFQSFTQAFIITKGGPVNSTFMYVLYLYQKGFARLEMGYASALAWILLVIIALATAFIFATSRYWVFYPEGNQKK